MKNNFCNPTRRSPLEKLCFILAFLLWNACSSKSQTPTEQVTKFIHQGIKAIENNQIGDVTSLLSETYQDPDGRTKKKMKRLVFFVLRRGSVTIFLENLQIQFKNDEATVDCELIGLQGHHKIKDIKDLLPKNAKRFNLKLKIAKEEDQWKLRSMSGDGFRLGMD
jgi:hypothetical protein